MAIGFCSLYVVYIIVVLANENSVKKSKKKHLLKRVEGIKRVIHKSRRRETNDKLGSLISWLGSLKNRWRT